MREYRKSKSGQNILVSESSFSKLGLPTANRLGIIRVKPGTDIDGILESEEGHKELANYQFGAVQNKDNGLFEMELVAVPVTAETVVE